MQDRRSVRDALLRGAIEVVVEDGFHRTVGTGADVDGAVCRRLETPGTIRPGQPNDPPAGPKALVRLGPLLQDQLAECRRRRSDQACVGTDALDCPASVTPMAGRHVFGDGRVLVIAAPRMCAAIRSPLRKISTVRAVRRASISARAKRCGTL